MANYASARKRAETGDAFGRTAIQIPETFKRIKIDREGTRKFDILPYVAGAGNPHADKGCLTDERSYFVHRGIGPNEEPFLCLAKNFGKRCPICEHAALLRKSGDADDVELAKDLRPRRRQLFIVRDVDDKESGIQIWDFSHPLFGEHLEERIRGSDEDDGYENYFHLEGGSTLRILFKEEFMVKNKYYEASSIDFKRRADIPERVMEKLPCLDDFLVELEYDALHSIYYGEGTSAGGKSSGAKSSTKGSKPAAKEDDWGDDAAPAKEDASAASEKKPRGRPPKEEAPAKESPKESAKAAPEKDDDWGDDEAPAKPSAKATEKPKPSAKAAAKDDDWD